MMVNAEQWLLEKAEEILLNVVTAPFEMLAKIGLSIVPDLTGYIMLASSGFIYLNAMIGRSINGPLGFATAIVIGSTSVLAVV